MRIMIKTHSSFAAEQAGGGEQPVAEIQVRPL
jgi:hypothetical protein